MFSAIKGLVQKDIKLTFRNPTLLVLSVIVPVVFVFIYSLIIQLSATNPVVIAQSSHGTISNRLVEIITTMESVDGPYFETITLDSKEAFELYHSGKAAALIEIPGTFEQDFEKGIQPKVNLYVYNINSDATKNFVSSPFSVVITQFRK